MVLEKQPASRNISSRALTFTLGVAIVGFFGLAGCNGGKDQANIELIQDMMEQRNLKSQKLDPLTGRMEAQVPPENTVPRGYTPYEFHNDAIAAEAKLINPLSADKLGDKFETSVARGKNRFEIYCTPCHGINADGKGKVAEFMNLKPPSLMSDKVRAFKDGRIYHIITDGQGLMNPYSTQIYKAEDRWAIVNYVRSLQKANK
jgi:mono/diheme cytochrome c family protein